MADKGAGFLESEAEAHQRVGELVLQGKLAPGAWYDPDHPCPLAEIGDAFERLWQHDGVKALIALQP